MLAIVVAAAIITPTPDVFNLMLFAIPMCALYFVGVFAGLALVMRREGRTLPWRKIILIALITLLIAAGVTFAMIYFHMHFTHKWPYVTK